jgi:hypothetical protein
MSNPKNAPFVYRGKPKGCTIRLLGLTQGMCHCFIRVSLAHVARNLSWELKGKLLLEKTINKPTSNICCFSATHIGVHSLGLTTWLFSFPSPIHSNYALTCSKIIPPWLHQLQALYLTLYLFTMLKNSMCKIVVPTHTNFLSLARLSCLTLFPKLIVLNPHVPNNFGIRPLTPTLLHVFNDWLWEHSIINWKVHIQLASLGKWVKLIYMGISLLEPSWPLS